MFGGVPFTPHNLPTVLGKNMPIELAEACGLRVAEVDFLQGVIRPMVQFPADELKSEASRSPVPIPRSMALELAEQVRLYPAPTLLSGADGGQLSTWALERAMRTARKKVPGCRTDSGITTCGITSRRCSRAVAMSIPCRCGTAGP